MSVLLLDSSQAGVVLGLAGVLRGGCGGGDGNGGGGWKRWRWWMVWMAEGWRRGFLEEERVEGMGRVVWGRADRLQAGWAVVGDDRRKKVLSIFRLGDGFGDVGTLSLAGWLRGAGCDAHCSCLRTPPPKTRPTAPAALAGETRRFSVDPTGNSSTIVQVNAFASVRGRSRLSARLGLGASALRLWKCVAR